MFAHLHIHSCYSLLDSIIKPQDLINKLKDMGHTAFALTDHGNVYASVKTYKIAKENNIKMIYGCEFYICDNITIKDKDNKYSHLIVLAKNEEGRKNINKLITKSYLDGFYYKPRIDFELLTQHKEGLIVLSACMAGEISKAILNNEIDKAYQIAHKYKECFGNDYYIELQSHVDEKQLFLNQNLLKMAKDLCIPYVITTDAHYLNKEDAELHQIFIQINREKEDGETYKDCYIQTEEEIYEKLKIIMNENEIRTGLDNTLEIVEKCNAQIPLSPPILPKVEIPKQYKNNTEYLWYLCKEGWYRHNFHLLPEDIKKQYKDRLIYEFKAIQKMNFIDYFIMVYDYANKGKRKGISRGSAGGSLISYLLNITDIDPIKYGLYFERFIDVSQIELFEKGQIKAEELKIPDIDLDYGEQDREQIIQYINQKYGHEKVSAIGTFQFIWDKMAIKDVGRVLGIPFNITNDITQNLGDDDLEEVIQKPYMQGYLEQYPKLFEYAQRIKGLPRSFGKHPCGKIIATKELEEYCPLQENEGEMVLQIDMEDAEKLGLVKVDILGLRTVDVIYDVLEMIGKDYEYINPQKLNLSDPKVFEIYKNGRTNGVFQFESDGMKDLLRKMQPNSIDDLAVANALYRPGSKKFVDNYINRKHGWETAEYLHPDLEPILKDTYGLIIYQEQLIEIGRLAGLRNPDAIRKACAKKKADLMQQIEGELKQGLLNKGWTQEQVDKLWANIVDFAEYSFNKSHAYGYTLLSYITAYLKTYHPFEFMCALLNSFEGKYDHLKKCYEEIKAFQIPLIPFNFRDTSPITIIKNNAIQIGLNLIKYCNVEMNEELNKIKNKNYDYFTDLLIDIEENLKINKRQTEVLITLGFFNEFGKNQKLLTIFNEFTEKYNKNHKKKKYQVSEELKQKELQIENKSLPINQQIIKEYEYLGFAITNSEDVDKRCWVVIDIDTKYTPRLTLYNIKEGIEKTAKLSKIKYSDNIKIGSVLGISNFKNYEGIDYIDKYILLRS